MKNYLILLLALVFLFACSKDEMPDNSKTSDTSLKTFSFQKSNNAALSSNVNSISGNDIFYLTIPEGVSANGLIPTFTIGEGAAVTINNAPVESGVTACDFSNTATVTVTAENGQKRSYVVCVKNGITKIDNLVYSFIVKYSIPGVSVSVSKNEETIYSYGYGFANVDTRERTTAGHLFRLASVSKQQTALCIMTLYEKGLIKLEDKVFGENGILKEEFGTSVSASAAQVTVRNLLEHTSGWISDPYDPMFTSSSLYTGKTLDERIAYVLGHVNQASTPGSQYSYYNLGFGILGRIIEKISGKDYETFLKEEVHAKAGITDIHVGGDRSKKRNNEVIYYSQDGTNGYGNDMEMIKAAGGIIASAPDLMKLMQCVDYGTKVPDILKKETLDLMYTPSAAYNRYGLGWRLNHGSFTNWAAYHSGNLAGTAAIWERGKNGVNAVVLCNSRSYKDGFDDELYYLLNNIQNLF